MDTISGDHHLDGGSSAEMHDHPEDYNEDGVDVNSPDYDDPGLILSNTLAFKAFLWRLIWRVRYILLGF